MKALILVDIQNDFCPGGALAVPEGDAILPIVHAIMPFFPIVVATQDFHPANHKSFASNHVGASLYQMIDWKGLPQVLWPDHCVQGTPGGEFHPSLQISHVTKVFPKGTEEDIDSYSGFFDNGKMKSTGMGEWLKTQGVSEVGICGLATDYCVKATALDAIGLGFTTYLILDACRGVELNAGDVGRAIQEMERAGVKLVSSQDILPK